MPLKVIGAGFGRTGTASLKAALDMIGFGPCYHMREVFEHPDHIAYWQAAVDDRLDRWEPILAGYESTCDWPACAFYEPLLALNPDAKVILTVRDPEKWYESALATIYPSSSHVNEDADPVRKAHSRMVNNLIWKGVFKGRFEDKAYAIEVFQQNTVSVKQKIPAEKLLVFDIQEGWEPLCAFLEIPVPVEAFPRVNDREAFLARRFSEANQPRPGAG